MLGIEICLAHIKYRTKFRGTRVPLLAARPSPTDGFENKSPGCWLASRKEKQMKTTTTIKKTTVESYRALMIRSLCMTIILLPTGAVLFWWGLKVFDRQLDDAAKTNAIDPGTGFIGFMMWVVGLACLTLAWFKYYDFKTFRSKYNKLVGRELSA